MSIVNDIIYDDIEELIDNTRLIKYGNKWELKKRIEALKKYRNDTKDRTNETDIKKYRRYIPAQIRLLEKELKEKENYELIKLDHIKDLIKRFVRDDVQDNKKYYENSLLYSLNFQYDNYTPEMIKKYDGIYEYLDYNIDEMHISDYLKNELIKKIEIRKKN